MHTVSCSALLLPCVTWVSLTASTQNLSLGKLRLVLIHKNAHINPQQVCSALSVG